jgi:hypothetical protein
MWGRTTPVWSGSMGRILVSSRSGMLISIAWVHRFQRKGRDAYSGRGIPALTLTDLTFPALVM